MVAFAASPCSKVGATRVSDFRTASHLAADGLRVLLVTRVSHVLFFRFVLMTRFSGNGADDSTNGKSAGP